MSPNIYSLLCIMVYNARMRAHARAHTHTHTHTRGSVYFSVQHIVLPLSRLIRVSDCICQTGGLNTMSRAFTTAANAFTETSNVVSEEMSLKFGIISQAASEDFAPYAKFAEQETEELMRQLSLMYNRNDLYLRDAHYISSVTMYMLR
jgi:GTP cyclohydrolase III